MIKSGITISNKRSKKNFLERKFRAKGGNRTRVSYLGKVVPNH